MDAIRMDIITVVAPTVIPASTVNAAMGYLVTNVVPTAKPSVKTNCLLVKS
jgi:hypothetical protein